MRKFLLLLMATSVAGASEVDFSQFNRSLDYAQVTHVAASQRSDRSWCFDATVRHHDQGWDHYADGWQVVDMAGNQLGYRLLAHPHDNEQPFTRRQCNIQIPDGVTKVAVRARCNVHGYGGKAVVVDLTRQEGEGYRVRRVD